VQVRALCDAFILSRSTVVSPYRIQAVNLTTRRPGFDPMPTHVGFVVDKVAVVNVFYLNTSILANQYRFASLNDGDAF
jgi:hypothetical protein